MYTKRGDVMYAKRGGKVGQAGAMVKGGCVRHAWRFTSREVGETCGESLHGRWERHGDLCIRSAYCWLA